MAENIMKLVFVLYTTLMSGLCFASCKSEAPSEYRKISESPRILFGEVHGTKESPAFFSAIACSASKQHERITIAIEWPSDLQKRVYDYLIADEPRRASLLQEWRFLSFTKDGRTSRAMLEMLLNLSDEIISKKIKLLLIDKPTEFWSEKNIPRGLTRDAYMWEMLRIELNENRPNQLFVLVGNYHVFKSTSSESNLRLGNYAEKFTIFKMQHLGGSAWQCVGDCGRQQVPGNAEKTEEVLQLDDSLAAGFFNVGRINASPPIISN